MSETTAAPDPGSVFLTDTAPDPVFTPAPPDPDPVPMPDEPEPSEEEASAAKQEADDALTDAQEAAAEAARNFRAVQEAAVKTDQEATAAAEAEAAEQARLDTEAGISPPATEYTVVSDVPLTTRLDPSDPTRRIETFPVREV